MKDKTTGHDTWALLTLFATVAVFAWCAGAGIHSACGREDLAGLGNRIVTCVESLSYKSYDMIDSLVDIILNVTDVIYNILYIDLCNLLLGL